MEKRWGNLFTYLSIWLVLVDERGIYEATPAKELTCRPNPAQLMAFPR